MEEKRTVKKAVGRADSPRLAPEHLQQLTAQSENTAMMTVRLIIDETHLYDETLPVAIVRGLLSPSVADFFIRIKGIRQIPREKAHYLHTSYIREVLLFDELPEG